jgi:riboflavin synthase
MEKKAGDSVNVEADILGKYVEKLLNRKEGKPEGLDLSFLREHGFLKGDESSHG